MTARLAAGLLRMLPGAGVGWADPRADHPAWPGEDIGPAVDKRLREFRAGRVAARMAMAALSLAPEAIPARPDRSPAFPAGLAGSIAHTATVALAAVMPGARGVGIDVEPAHPIDPALWATILRPDEFADPLTVFVAKEAAYKAQYTVSRRIMDFHALRVVVEGETFTATFAQPVPPFAQGDRIRGHWADIDGHLLAAVSI